MLLRSIARRFESLPAESISQNPSKSLIEALGGGQSLAGVPVTADSASGVPAVFSCDKVIKEDIAKTPIKVKKKNADGTRQDDPNHPVYALLHDMANPFMTAYQFKEHMQSSLNLWGNAYAEIIRNQRNEPTALFPLDPSRMTVSVNSLNNLVYCYRMQDGTTKEWTWNASNPPIFHLRQNATQACWWMGRSPIKVVRDYFGLSIAQNQYQARHFGQGGHSQLALSTDQPVNDPVAAQRIVQDFEKVTRGVENSHRAVFMPFGLKATALAMPHKDAQFVELLKMSRSTMCGVFRIYGQKVNDLERATFSNVTELNIAHVNDTLGPHYENWTQTIAMCLLNNRSFNTHFAFFETKALMKGDFKSLIEALGKEREIGVVSANDIRKYLDMDDLIPVDQGGDDYLVNGGLVPMRRDPSFGSLGVAH